MIVPTTLPNRNLCTDFASKVRACHGAVRLHSMRRKGVPLPVVCKGLAATIPDRVASTVGFSIHPFVSPRYRPKYRTWYETPRASIKLSAESLARKED